MARPGRGFDGFARGSQQFEAMGLPVPPVPEKLRSRLHVVEDWCFATRDIRPMGMYFFEDYLLQALTGQAPDYLAFSWSGHGINSYAVNYHLVDGSLALFAQAPWGGRYTDAGAAAEALSQLFVRCAALIEIHASAVQSGRLQSPGRLLVCESELRGIGGWVWLDEAMPTREAASEWVKSQRGPVEYHIASPPTLNAMNWIRELQA